MDATIKRCQPDAEYLTPEGCFINELSNSAADAALSIARARLAPGVTTHWHRLQATAERYVILHGQGRVEVGNLASEVVNPGDVVLIPPLCPQRIFNTGTDDLIFLAICTPAFSQANYEDIEDTQYLLSIPGMRESIKEGMATPLTECSDTLDW